MNTEDLEARIAELEARVRLLIRVDRLNQESMSDKRVLDQCAEFQVLAAKVEQEDPQQQPPIEGFPNGFKVLTGEAQ